MPIPKDPASWLILFREQMNEIFTFLSQLELSDKVGEHEFVPLLDIFETAEEYVVEFELPGFSATDLSLSICCNTLVLEGNKRQEQSRSRTNYICLERTFGRFCRTVEIPPLYDVNGVHARYDRGVLVVSFPRLQGKSVVIRDIPIEQGE
ncbi:MAG TPA: Hsp20/alpha crystallin family protein [Bacteroidota bacterium]